MVSAEVFLGLSHQVQALSGMMLAIIPHIPQLTQMLAPPQLEPQQLHTTLDGSREHAAPVRHGLAAQDLTQETRSEAPSLVPEKSATPHLEVEHSSREPDTLSSDSTESL
ncbi:hypothetical protein GW17_00061237 [Ensete ventricosum]|nr:hypothetical protein GW17_00061237 [Ensete ventricosum]